MPSSTFFRTLASWCCLLAALLSSAPTAAASPPESEEVARARELVDTYYGKRSNLDQASELLARAYKANPADPNIFVHAARIEVMGSPVNDSTIDRYASLLDKALALDPSNAKAHLLKAEVFEYRKDLPARLKELELAKALGPNDPWVAVGWARYYFDIKDFLESFNGYSSVVEPGPGTSASERKAYVAAIDGLMYLKFGDDSDEEALRRYAALALKGRHPADAWTPVKYAELFIDQQLFQEAIVYAREALRTMDSSAGRITLAAALYARAAQMQIAGRPASELAPLVVEARQFRHTPKEVLEYLVVSRGDDGSLRVFEPAIRKLMK